MIQLTEFAYRSSLLQGYAQLVSMLQLIEQFLGFLEILAVMSEKRVAKEILLTPIQALWMVWIEPLLEPATAWP